VYPPPSHGKIDFLEGLRGLCCLIVVIDHCVNTFYPALRWTTEDGVWGGIRAWIALSPLNFIYSGITPVYIFFILSGFVLSFKFFKTFDINIPIDGAIKRYFRLVVPVLASMVLIYIITKFLYIFGITEKSGKHFWDIFYQSFYAAFFKGKSWNGVLWTMPIELKGSMLVFALAVLFSKIKFRYVVYIISAVLTYESLLILFVFGMFMCDEYVTRNNYRIMKIDKNIILVMLVLGAVFATFPYQRTNVDIDGSIYGLIWIDSLKTWVANHRLYHLLGTIILFVCFMNSDGIRKVFEGKILLWLGKISFSLYVLHSVFIFAIHSLLIKMISGNSPQMMIFGMIVTLPICLVVSYFFEKFIDRSGIKFANYVCRLVKKS